MFYTYVLQSMKDNELYIGYTNDLKRRVEEHNAGGNTSTQRRRPFSLVYYEAYRSEDNARRREEGLKQRGQARVQLMRRISSSLQQE